MSKKKRCSIRLELPAETAKALEVWCERHGASMQGAIRKILHVALNVDGGSAGNA